MRLELHWSDVSGMVRLENALVRLDGPRKHLVLQRAVNRTGDMARTKVIRALSQQTGLPVKVIRKAVKNDKATGAGLERATGDIFVSTGANLTYVLRTQGGDISLKFFRARETRKGVSAAPRGERKIFPGTFMKGGRFPNRVTAKGLNGHVYRRTGKGRGPLEFVDSGVTLPVEMLRGASAEAFTSTVEETLPRRVMHEIEFLCPGIFG